MPKLLRILIISALAAVLTALNAFAAEPASAQGGVVSTAQEFVDALGGDSAAYADANSIVLLSDVTLSEPIVIKSGEYTINGRGCYIYRETTEELFQIGSDAVLTLGDSGGSDGDPSLTLDCGEVTSASAAITINGGTLNIYAGTLISDAENPIVQGISTSGGGGAVSVTSGALNMYGGVIAGCSAERGGAVCISGGEFTQTGGSISGCSATYGGAIFVGETGTYNAAGITLSANHATVGGAICGWGTIAAMNCEFSNNTSKSQGGAVAVLAGTFDMVGGYIVYCGAGETEIASADITNDDMTVTGGMGGGVYNTGETTLYSTQLIYCDAGRGSAVSNDGGTLNLNEIAINYNRASECASVYSEGGELIMTGGSISSNDAEQFCGGVYTSGAFTLDGGSISSNTSKNGAQFALGVLNDGDMTVKNGAFISFNNDVGMTPRATFTIGGALTANTPISTLTPLADIDGAAPPYEQSYEKGRALVSGDLSQLDKLAVSDFSGRAYTFDESGALKNNGRSADAPFPYLTVVMICVIVIAVAALVMIFLKASGVIGGKRSQAKK